DTHLWSEDYERDLANILAMQAEVALAITKRISVTVTSEQRKQLTSAPSVNPEAYEFYLKGRHFLWYREVNIAVENFLRAIDKDPQYAKAYAGLAESYVIFEGAETPLTPQEALGRAKVAASRALQLDSKLAEPHATLAWAKLTFDRDWAGAEE